MLHQCGPQSWSTLFATRADVTAAQPLIQHCTSRRPLPQEARADKCRPELVLAAQRLCVSAVLPDSGEHTPRLFRMSAHVPVNAVLLFGMRSSTSVAASALWQVGARATSTAPAAIADATGCVMHSVSESNRQCLPGGRRCGGPWPPPSAYTPVVDRRYRAAPPDSLSSTPTPQAALN